MVIELAIAFLQNVEGFRAEPYDDKTGRTCTNLAECEGTLTIGYGRTHDVEIGDYTTKEREESWLRTECVLLILNIKNHLGDDVYLTEHQEAALISFTYNVGLHHFKTSTLASLLKEHDYVGAANEFQKWKYAHGQVNEGLCRRREAEERLFVGLPTEVALKTPKNKGGFIV